MRRVIPVLFAILLITQVSSPRADALESEAQLLKLAEGVMAKVAMGDLDDGFKAMKPYLIIPQEEFDALVVNTKAQRSLAGARYGKVVGSECFGQKKLGQSLARVMCIEKTEKHALPWLFYFYKSPNGWVLNSFVWNDNLPAAFSL
jgi:hypothetical protein